MWIIQKLKIETENRYKIKMSQTLPRKMRNYFTGGQPLYPISILSTPMSIPPLYTYVL